MLQDISTNVAEAIPYKTHKEKFRLVGQELKKNRHVEIIDKPKIIYSMEKYK